MGPPLFHCRFWSRILKVTILEGTPEEIQKALPGLSAASGIVIATQAATAVSPADGPESDDSDFVSEAVAKKVLTRRPLSREQTQVLRLLYKAGDAGLLGTELQSKIGYSRPQFTGLMGAFGNRVGNTPGYVPGTWFFDQAWDYDEASNRYKLPASVRDALKNTGVV